MSILVSFDKSNVYIDYNSKNKFINPIGQRNDGWYKYVNGKLSALIIKKNNIYFVCGDFQSNIKEIEFCEANDISKYVTEVLLITKDGTKVKLLYESDKELANVEPFDYIDKEDYDWGFFLCNIINSKERQENILSNRDMIN